jgi:hypothetical protein
VRAGSAEVSEYNQWQLMQSYYCELHNNRLLKIQLKIQFPIENHSEQGQFAELPLKMIGKCKIWADHYAIRSTVRLRDGRLQTES